MEPRRHVNAVLARTIGYQLSRPPAGRAWRYPSPQRLNKMLSRTTGYQLSRPLAGRGRPSTPPPGSRLLTAPVFILSAARSGSTLMRVILGSHSRLYAPPELPLKHLGVRADTPWIRASTEALGLTVEELDYMLWDRVLADALERHSKPTIVVKTPSNVLIWEQIAACWPDAKFIVLLRHPAASVASLHASWDPAWHAAETGTFDEAVAKGLRYMTRLEEARRALPDRPLRGPDRRPGSGDPSAVRFCRRTVRARHAGLRQVPPRRPGARPGRHLGEHTLRSHPGRRTATGRDPRSARRDVHQLGLSPAGGRRWAG